jgi:hypothetical protein
MPENPPRGADDVHCANLGNIVVFQSYQARSNVKPSPIIKIENVMLQNGHEIPENTVPILLVIDTSAIPVMWEVAVGLVKVFLSTGIVGESVSKVDFGSTGTTEMFIQLRSFDLKVP